jgi:fumarylacetoacetase
LLNDWSARDIQQWEYVPLGPFLGKNFATTISPWVVPLEALDPFRLASPKQEPDVLPYLQTSGWRSYDIELSVYLSSQTIDNQLIASSNTKYLYWNMCQQLAHHTSNGCPVRVGDLMGSGTISAPSPDGYGSMLELAWKGTKPLQLPDGSQRTFLNDGDSIMLRGFAEKKGIRVGFGECQGKIV